MWKTFNTNLRNNASLANAHITTYTYSPWIGMTSKTNSAGVITYYEYDNLGRLSSVKNDDNRLINNYIYHYGAN
ncbi:MAG: hypothetical protein ACM3ME_00185 [Chloroflexota bacterium]